MSYIKLIITRPEGMANAPSINDVAQGIIDIVNRLNINYWGWKNTVSYEYEIKLTDAEALESSCLSYWPALPELDH